MDETSKTTTLSEKTCVPCRGGIEPLTEPQMSGFLKQLSPEWMVVGGRRLERTFQFKNFKEALDFTNKVGHLAENQQHHPDIHLSLGRVKIELWTHKIGGLHQNDFILAAAIDTL